MHEDVHAKRCLQYMLRRQWILLWKSVRHLTGRLARMEEEENEQDYRH